MNRAANIQRLQEEEFDLCIIGGGVSGAGCALDAALRGLKVALVEKNDFASDTSSKSTKLIHGGVRYLEQAFKKLDFAQLRQVRHGLQERRNVIKNAPHLAHPLGLVTPVFSWLEGLYYWIGLKIYDGIAGKNSNVPSSRWLSKKEALEMMPGLSPKINSAVLYYDGQMDDARYCLALIQSASEFNHCIVANHLEVVGFQKDTTGKIISAQVTDGILSNNSSPAQIHLTIRARKFLNCSGAHSDQIRLLANPALTPRISPSKGVHLVLPPEILKSDKAVLIPKTRDGRMVFAVPFESNLLMGTTDEPLSRLDQEPVLEAAEADFLLETLQPYVAQNIDRQQVKAGFGGARPLLAPTQAECHALQTKSLLRDHEVEIDALSGLFSLLGGKWTTYRLMACDAIDAILRDWDLTNEKAFFNVTPVSTTSDYLLWGAQEAIPGDWQTIQNASGLDEDICRHLLSKYGDKAKLVVEVGQENDLFSRILPDYPFIKAEIVYAAKLEMACTVRDFLARRIRLEIMDWNAAQEAAPIVAHWLGIPLGWSQAEQKRAAEDYIRLVQTFKDAAQKP